MAFFSRRRTDDDFSDEVQAHIDLEVDRLMADGMSPEEAHAAARRAFGNATLARERFHETSRWIWLEQLAQDLRYAWRGMRHSPPFVATTVLTLAVALGLVTIAFTIFNAYVLRPYAVRDPHSLHQIIWHSRHSGGSQFRWREYEALAGCTDLFSATVAEQGRPSRPTAGRCWPSSRRTTSPISHGDRARAGLGAIENGATAIVLSHEGWTRLVDRDPGALRRTINLNGQPFTIVGVTAPGFSGLDEARDAWCC